MSPRISVFSLAEVSQEWPRQTKPKKGQFMNFSQGHSGTKVQCESCTWVKPGRFGSFFVLCFLALGGHCLQMLCLPGFGTHANTQNLPHFRASPASIQEHSPPKCLFFMANAKLPNRPGFALLPVNRSCFHKENTRIHKGGFPIWTCPSFLVLFCPFWDFPDFSWIFPICLGTLRGFS